MSFQSAVEKLESPVKDLVLAATQDGSQHVGKTETDQSLVTEWIEKVRQGDIVNEASLKVWDIMHAHHFGFLTILQLNQDLDSQLVPRTYIVGNYLTAADVALYGALHPTLVCKLFSHMTHVHFFFFCSRNSNRHNITHSLP